jgi:hypothetical protein
MIRSTALFFVAVFFFAAPAFAQHAMPSFFPADEKEPLFVIGRAGIGADSNVLRDPDSGTRGALLRGDLRGEWEPLPDLRILLDGVFEGDLASTPNFIYETESGLIVTYRKDLIGGLALSLGSFTEYTREPSVFLAGRVIASGAALRAQFSERFTPMLSYQLGPIDLEAGARGEIENVQGLEAFNELGIEPFAGIRAVVVPRFLALRVRYTFDHQIYSGLPARDLNGDLFLNPQDLRLDIHAIRGTVRFHPISEITAALHFDEEWILDPAAGFMTGNRQRARTELFFEFGPLATEVAAELTLRQYTARTPSPDIMMDNRDYADPTFEGTFDAYIDTDIWITRFFGVYLRYEIQRYWANPTGLLYFRQLISVGPSLRFDESLAQGRSGSDSVRSAEVAARSR